MNVLGAYTITALQQRTLAAGSTMEIPRYIFRPKILREAMIGDLIWVKEPFAEIRSKRFSPKKIHEVVRGASLITVTAAIPDHVRPYIEHCHLRMHPASSMEKTTSCASLEIMTIGEHTVRCLLHLKPFSEVLTAGRVAQ